MVLFALPVIPKFCRLHLGFCYHLGCVGTWMPDTGTFIWAWLSNYIIQVMWDAITYPWPWYTCMCFWPSGFHDPNHTQWVLGMHIGHRMKRYGTRVYAKIPSKYQLNISPYVFLTSSDETKWMDVMAWCCIGDKPLSESVVILFIGVYMSGSHKVSDRIMKLDSYNLYSWLFNSMNDTDAFCVGYNLFQSELTHCSWRYHMVTQNLIDNVLGNHNGL